MVDDPTVVYIDEKVTVRLVVMNPTRIEVGSNLGNLAPDCLHLSLSPTLQILSIHWVEVMPKILQYCKE